MTTPIRTLPLMMKRGGYLFLFIINGNVLIGVVIDSPFSSSSMIMF
jgi:hypothetical protein